MLSYLNLVNNFSDITRIGHGVVRCSDVLPRVTYYYYIRMGEENLVKHYFLLASGNMIDDDFASSILSSACSSTDGMTLEKFLSCENKYGFSHVLIVPKDFHSYFKGRLDEERQNLLLCIPIYNREFSGNESLDEFAFMRRDSSSMLDWGRTMTPKIMFRFDNPVTQGGTGGTAVFVKFETVLREVEYLSGFGAGFIEVTKYRGQIVDVLSSSNKAFILIRDLNDSKRESLDGEKLHAELWNFLTT
jgi:hypothetical protein